jgi:hypothetical protein
MADLNSKMTLLKAQYFLEQARKAEADPAILAERLPFAANLEAAIIYARSSIDHLRNEFAQRYNSKGYRTWHATKWEALCRSDAVGDYFANRRNFIVHQEPEKTNARIFAEAKLSIKTAVSVEMTVIRADGTVEGPDSEALDKAPPKKEKALSDRDTGPDRAQDTSSTKISQQFFFADPDWRAEPAVIYVQHFIDICRKFISDAEAKFAR